MFMVRLPVHSTNGAIATAIGAEAGRALPKTAIVLARPARALWWRLTILVANPVCINRFVLSLRRVAHMIWAKFPIHLDFEFTINILPIQEAPNVAGVFGALSCKGLSGQEETHITGSAATAQVDCNRQSHNQKHTSVEKHTRTGHQCCDSQYQAHPWESSDTA